MVSNLVGGLYSTSIDPLLLVGRGATEMRQNTLIERLLSALDVIASQKSGHEFIVKAYYGCPIYNAFLSLDSFHYGAYKKNHVCG